MGRRNKIDAEIKRSLLKLSSLLKAIEGLLKNSSLVQLEEVQVLVSNLINNKIAETLIPGEIITIYYGREKIKKKVRLHKIMDGVVLVKNIDGGKLGSRYTVPVSISKVIRSK